MASADWFKKKLYVVLLAGEGCRSNLYPAHPRSARGIGRAGCAPVNAEGFRGTRMEARWGLVTATEQEGIAEDMLRTGLKRGA